VIRFLKRRDSLLETPMISHPAVSSLLVVAKPMPSELPTIIAFDRTNNTPSFFALHHDG
jgi:hypothetical protein